MSGWHVPASTEESPRGAPDQAFASAAIPLVRDFVKSNYKDYKKGKAAWMIEFDRICWLFFFIQHVWKWRSLVSSNGMIGNEIQIELYDMYDLILYARNFDSPSFVFASLPPRWRCDTWSSTSLTWAVWVLHTRTCQGHGYMNRTSQTNSEGLARRSLFCSHWRWSGRHCGQM